MKPLVVKSESVFAFQRPDGTWMKVERDGCATYAEWVSDLGDATFFSSDRGLGGDHRWKDMLGDAHPRAFLFQATVITLER